MQRARKRVRAKKLLTFVVSGTTATVDYLNEFYARHEGLLHPFEFTYDGITEICTFSEKIDFSCKRELQTTVGFEAELHLAVEHQNNVYEWTGRVFPLKPKGNVVISEDWNTNVLDMGASGRIKRYDVPRVRLEFTVSGLKEDRDKLIQFYNTVGDHTYFTFEYDDFLYQCFFEESLEITDKRELDNIVGFESDITLLCADIPTEGSTQVLDTSPTVIYEPFHKDNISWGTTGEFMLWMEAGREYFTKDIKDNDDWSDYIKFKCVAPNNQIITLFEKSYSALNSYGMMIFAMEAYRNHCYISFSAPYKGSKCSIFTIDLRNGEIMCGGRSIFSLSEVYPLSAYSVLHLNGCCMNTSLDGERLFNISDDEGFYIFKGNTYSRTITKNSVYDRLLHIYPDGEVVILRVAPEYYQYQVFDRDEEFFVDMYNQDFWNKSIPTYSVTGWIFATRNHIHADYIHYPFEGINYNFSNGKYIKNSDLYETFKEGGELYNILGYSPISSSPRLGYKDENTSTIQTYTSTLEKRINTDKTDVYFEGLGRYNRAFSKEINGRWAKFPLSVAEFASGVCCSLSAWYAYDTSNITNDSGVAKLMLEKVDPANTTTLIECTSRDEKYNSSNEHWCQTMGLTYNISPLTNIGEIRENIVKFVDMIESGTIADACKQAESECNFSWEGLS